MIETEQGGKLGYFLVELTELQNLDMEREEKRNKVFLLGVFFLE
jgi:hypothetical protein